MIGGRLSVSFHNDCNNYHHGGDHQEASKNVSKIYFNDNFRKQDTGSIASDFYAYWQIHKKMILVYLPWEYFPSNSISSSRKH